MRQLLRLAAVALLVATLPACAAFETARDAAYGFAADKGNQYCDTRDPSFEAQVEDRINGKLREEGARFRFDGLTCDAPALDPAPAPVSQAPLISWTDSFPQPQLAALAPEPRQLE